MFRLRFAYASGLLWLICVPPAVADPPVWTVDPAAFETNLTLTGAVFVDGIKSQNPSDRLAAVVAGQVRGVASSTEVAGRQLFFLSVYGSSGEAVSFKFYDAGRDWVLDLDWEMVFQPDAVIGTLGTPVVLQGTYPVVPSWNVEPARFASSISMTAVVTVGGKEVQGTENVLAAFIEGEVRGVASPQLVGNRALFFLVVHGHSGDAGVSFRLWHAESKRVLELGESVGFVPNAILGSVSDPFAFTVGGTATAIELPPSESAQSSVLYPNPSTGPLRIRLPAGGAGRFTVRAYDLAGREVLTERGFDGSWTREVPLDASALPAGRYLLRVETTSHGWSRMFFIAR